MNTPRFCVHNEMDVMTKCVIELYKKNVSKIYSVVNGFLFPEPTLYTILL